MRINIDATQHGNVARFVNHACGAAANIGLELFAQAGCMLPRVAMVTCRAVAAMEELCFEYGAPRRRAGAEDECFCGGLDCLGGMPVQSD